jgi:hypothetical protein
MPKTRRTPQIVTRLAPSTYLDFEKLCRLEGQTKSELARRAITWFIENQEQLMSNERDSVLEKRLKKMEDRIAKLLVKVGIEVCSQGHLFWTRTEREIRRDLFKECYAAGVRRMKNKLADDEDKLVSEFKKP